MYQLNISERERDVIILFLQSCHGCCAGNRDRVLRVVRVEWADGDRPHAVATFCDGCLARRMKYFKEVYVLAVSRPTAEQRQAQTDLYRTWLTDHYETAFLAAYEGTGPVTAAQGEEQMVAAVVARVQATYYRKLNPTVHAGAAAAALGRVKERLRRLKGQPSPAAAAATALSLMDYDGYRVRKVSAIKVVREMTGAGLKEAKDAVEAEALKRWPPQPAQFTAEGGIQNGRAA